jgi:hypothetical protein
VKSVSRSLRPVRADHAVEHRVEPVAVAAEADEDRPVIGEIPVGDVAPEDLPEPILVRPGDVRRRRLRIELRAWGVPAAPDRRLALVHG